MKHEDHRIKARLLGQVLDPATGKYSEAVLIDGGEVVSLPP